jgi:hypothetical protein
MTIENLPVWTIEPNWSRPVTESLEWLTSVLSSPSGAEQRRCMRLYPRRHIEFDVATGNAERSAAEQTIMIHGGRTLYLPMWQEAYRLTNSVSIGATTLSMEDASNGSIRAGDVLYVGSVTSVVDYELVSVASVVGDVVTLDAPIENDWPKYSRVHPVRKARFVDQPSFQRVGDSVATGSVNFMIMQQNDEFDGSVVPPSFDTYLGNYVLTSEPDSGQALDRNFERNLDTFDTELSLPLFRDTANISFGRQTYQWTNRGHAEYLAFKSMLYWFAGRLRNLWLPTFNSDLNMVADTPAGAQFLTVDNIGFTAAGGVAEGRTHVCIFKADGTRIYRQITGSTVTAAGDEVIGINGAVTGGLPKASVIRISFMQLCRLDQDRIEIAHQTDTRGVSSCSASFRAAPNLRQIAAGF